MEAEVMISLKERVEHFGVFFEKESFPPVAAGLYRASLDEFSDGLHLVDNFFEEYVEELPKIIAKRKKN